MPHAQHLSTRDPRCRAPSQTIHPLGAFRGGEGAGPGVTPLMARGSTSHLEGRCRPHCCHAVSFCAYEVERFTQSSDAEGLL